MKTNKPAISYLFLLGGQDLEMITIRALLEDNGYEEGVDFLDYQLQWGAKCSAYKSVIEDSANKNRQIVGIELQEDIPLPPHYLSIDHHNDRSEAPASIEQLAKLLGIVLNRHQLLVAINDKSYTAGLSAFGASKEEITSIRKQDRMAQGVTAAMEAQAILDLKTKTVKKGIALVKTSLTKFSPISDRLSEAYQAYLIYNAQELTFYGKGASILKQHYKELIAQGLAYAGGQGDGFFGLARNPMLDSDKVADYKNEIITLITESSNGK